MKKLIVVSIVLVMVMFSFNASAEDIRTPEKAIETFKTFITYVITFDSRLGDIVCSNMISPIESQSQARFEKMVNIFYDPYHGVDVDLAVKAVKEMKIDFNDMSAEIVDEKFITIKGTFNGVVTDPESGVKLPVISDEPFNGTYPMVVQGDRLIMCR